MMIYATSQRWNFVDKQLRDIVASVRVCRVHLGHPFSRMGTVHVYDAVDYDRSFNNPLLPCPCVKSYAYIQTDAVRNRYDTTELIENMLHTDYISDDEILRNRGEETPVFSELSKSGKRTARRNIKRLTDASGGTGA